MAKKKVVITKNNSDGIVKKRVKIRYGRIFIVLCLLFAVLYSIFKYTDHSIKNIYITGNNNLSDSEIIELAGLSNYPSTFTIFSPNVESKLEDNDLIKKATVSKDWLFKIKISVEENYPVYYDTNINKTILLDGTEIKDIYDIPVLINYVPDNIKEEFIEKMGTIDLKILNKISEIEYKPNEVDEELFYLSMKDGNYVYLTLNKFNNINQYLDIITKFPNQKGILYLDSGEYFEVMDIN